MGNITYINAGAGSGKTYRLTHDLADAMIKDGIRPSEIILTTFTKAAASEFREKARAALLEADRPDTASELGGAAIGTVHSVCERFVKKYWYSLGLSPDMDVISNEDRQIYVNQSIADAADEKDLIFFDKFRKDFNVSKYSDGVIVPDPDFWKDCVSSVISAMAAYDIKNLERSTELSKDAVMKVFSSKPAGRSIINAFLTAFTAWAPNNKRYTDPAGKIRELRDLVNGSGSYAGLSALASWIDKNMTSTFTKANPSFPADRLKDTVNDLLTSSDYGKEICECIDRVFGVARKWKEQYEKYKVEQHLLDYDDMEQYFLKILTDDRFVEERAELARYRLVMVDEFQDSNPVQVRIFKELARIIEPGGGRCVWVGDPKQSIYGFRGSDTGLILEETEKLDAKDKSSLDTSYRSRPQLVHLVNDTFPKAFEGILDGSLVKLDHQDRDAAELSGHSPLLHWHCAKGSEPYYAQLAVKIQELLGSGLPVCEKKRKGERLGKERAVRPGDVAVLCRNGMEVQKTVSALRSAGIPVSSTTPDLLDWAEVQLVIDMLRYISDPYIPEVRASIVHLVENVPTRDLLIRRAGDVSDRYKDGKWKDGKDTWLTDRDLFRVLDSIAERSDSSVSDTVSAVILEIGLRSLVGKWTDPDARRQNLTALEGLAEDYESHCRRLRLSSTVAGFIEWLSEQDFSNGDFDNEADAVKVITYHRSKGLEWKVVVLESLGRDINDTKDLMKKEYTSVKPLKDVDGDYYVHFFPKISGAGDIPAAVVTRIEVLPEFGAIRDKIVAEEKRLLYVGITRARDYLVTTSHKQKNSDKAPVLPTLDRCGVGLPAFSASGSKAAVWIDPDGRYAADFSDITALCVAAPTAGAGLKEEEWKGPEKKDAPVPLVVSPSKARASESVMDSVRAEVVGTFSPLAMPIKDETGCGTCIHNIYAAYRPGMDRWNEEMAARLVDAGGFADQITDIPGILEAERNLFAWLEERYGKAAEILREVPFTLVLDREQAAGTGLAEGQDARGEIDLVWKRQDGSCVLVDYKSYGRVDADINDPKVRVHYAGYAPQLGIYRSALDKAGMNVTDTLIYYPVQGRIVRIC